MVVRGMPTRAPTPLEVATSQSYNGADATTVLGAATLAPTLLGRVTGIS